MTRILVLTARNSGRQFKWNNLKNKEYFIVFFVAFLEFTSSFQHLKKKDQANRSTVSDISDSERSCYLSVLKAMF